MTEIEGDGPRRTQEAYARFAGLMYLFTAFDVTGVVIVARIGGGGGFVESAHRIAEWETLYRIALLFGLIGTLSTLLLGIGLYVALKPVDGNLALAALLFRLAETTIGGVVVALAFATLQINLVAIHASALDARQLGALADIVARTSAVGTNVSVVFFAVGSTIFFYLFVRSGYIPRSLATWGLLGSLLCFAAFTANLLLPQSSELLLGVGGLPIGIAEPVVGLWLLVRGIKPRSPASHAISGRV